MLRKISVLLASLIILTFAFSTASFAGEKIMFETKEIKDLPQLEDRIKHGVTDDSIDYKHVKNTLHDAPIDLDVKQGVTTQKLKEVKMEDGTIKTSYATTVISDIKKRNPPKTAALNFNWTELLASSGSWDENDSSLSIRHVATYYYTKYRDANNILWVNPDSSTYKWYQLDSAVQVTKATYGCSWYDINGGGNNYQTLSSVSFGTTYSRPDSVSRYVNCTVGGCYVAFKQESTLKRGTTTWTFTSDMVWAENLYP